MMASSGWWDATSDISDIARSFPSLSFRGLASFTTKTPPQFVPVRRPLVHRRRVPLQTDKPAEREPHGSVATARTASANADEAVLHAEGAVALADLAASERATRLVEKRSPFPSVRAALEGYLGGFGARGKSFLDEHTVNPF